MRVLTVAILSILLASCASDSSSDSSHSDSTDSTATIVDMPDTVVIDKAFTIDFEGKSGTELTDIMGDVIYGGDSVLYSGYYTMSLVNKVRHIHGPFQFASAKGQTKMNTSNFCSYAGTKKLGMYTDTLDFEAFIRSKEEVILNCTVRSYYVNAACQGSKINGLFHPDLTEVKDSLEGVCGPDAVMKGVMTKWGSKIQSKKDTLEKKAAEKAAQEEVQGE